MRRPLLIRAMATGLVTALLAAWVFAQPAIPTGQAALFRLVPLPADGLRAALDRVDHGTLVRMSATDFERLTRSAAKNADTGAVLLATRYRGRVTIVAGEPALVGTGEWVVRSPGPDAALNLPAALTPIRQAKWPDGRDAVLFKPSREDVVRLIAPAAGDLSLNLDWSARGLTEPSEVRFDLRVPPSPIAGLDLELPAGYVPVVPADEALLTGPFPADQGTSWHLSFGGEDRLSLVLRRVDDGRPRLFTKSDATQRLTGADGTARYDVQIDSARGGFTDLEFTFDALLTPTGVRVNNLAGWDVDAGDGPARRLRVRLSEPTRSATVVVSATFSVPQSPVRWVSPALSLTDAVSRGERLLISVAPAVRFQDWRPGGYRLVRAERSVEGPYLLEVEPDVGAAGRAADRPSFVVRRPADSTWKVHQQADWTIGPASEEWVVRNAVEVTAGAVPAVVVRAPDGWVLDRAEVNGLETAAEAVSARRVSIDLGRLVKQGEAVEVTTRLRRPREPRPPGEELRFPDLLPVGAAARDGRLTIHVDPTLDGVPTDPPRDESRPAVNPADRTPGTFDRLLTSEPLAGSLYVRPKATHPSADLRTEECPAAGGRVIRTCLTIRPGGGALPGVTIWVAAAPAGPWAWQDGLGRRAAVAARQPAVETVRWLAGFGGLTAVGSAADLAAVQAIPGSCWNIHFPRPVTEPTVFSTAYETKDRDSTGPWVIGLPFAGEVRPSAPAEGPIRYYGTAARPPAAAIDDRPTVTVDGGRFLTIVDADGRTEAAFRVRARGGPLSVRLPEEAGRRRVTVAGRSFPVEGGRDLQIPIPGGGGWTEVEIRYAGPELGSGLFVQPAVELPEGPFDPNTVQRVWHISPAWRMAVRRSAVLLPGTKAGTSELPLPDWRAATFSPLDSNPEEVPALPGVSGPTLRSALRAGRPDSAIVFDAFALAEAGIPVDAPVVAESVERFLAARGLAVADVAGVSLVTTEADARRWPLDESVAAAVAEASVYGRDAFGRFRAIDLAHSDAPAWPPPPPGWEVWTSDDPTPPVLTRADRVAPTAWGVSFVLFLVTVAVRTGPRIRFVVLTAWLAVATVGVVRGDDIAAEAARPLLFGAIGAGLVGCLRRARPPAAGPSSRRPQAAGATAALVLAAGAYAAESVPVVYQLPAEPGKPAVVLVPPKLLDRLRVLGATGPVEIAVTAADYTGTRDRTACRIQARFRLWVFADGPARLTLPFQTLRLREVQLDGADAGGVSSGPDGLVVAVAGRGEHTLDVRFEVPVGTAGADREVKFPTPEVPVSRLRFELPRPGTKLRAGPWRGAARMTTVRETELLDVDLGPTPHVQVRWAVDGGERAAPVRAREAAVWRAGDGTLRLDSLTELRVTGGGPSDVQIAVPAAAEVYRLAVRAEGLPAGSPPTRIQAWALAQTDGSPFRTLTVTFASPLEGRTVLELEMYATGRAALFVPRLLKVPDVESQAAFAVSGPTGVPAVETTGLVAIPPDVFVKGVWAALGGGPVQPVLAYRTTGPGPARLTPAVRPSAAKGAATEVTWWVEDTRLLARATSRVPGAPGPGLVEWRVRDGVRLTEVTGPRLVDWSQTGDHVQTWFDRPVPDGVVRWAAVKPRPNMTGELAVPAPDFGPESVTTVRVRPTGGWAVGGRGPGEPLPPTAPGELAYRETGAEPGRLMSWAPALSALSLSTVIRRGGSDREVVTSIDLTPLGRDRPHRLTVLVARAEGATISLTGPGLTSGEVLSEGGGRRWDVAVPAGRPADSLSVVVRRPEGNWPVPRVTVRAGPGRPADPMRSLRVESGAALTDVVGLTRIGPAEWRADSPLWEATAVGRTAESDRPRLSGAVIRAARVGTVWAYRGRFEVMPDEAGATRVHFPAAATPASVECDGRFLPIAAGEIVLPTAPGSQEVVLRWTTAEPGWDAPRFRTPGGDWTSGPIDWIVCVPPGLRPEGAVSADPLPMDAAAREEAFQNGLPVHFRSLTGAGPDVRFVAPVPPWRQAALAFALWVCFTLLLIAPPRLRPERAAVVGALGAVAFGPAGAAFWLIPVGTLVYRAGHILSAVRGRAKSVP